MSGVKQYNIWYDRMAAWPAEKREAWVEKVLVLMEAKGGSKYKELVKMLRDKSKCKIIGISPYIEYARVSGKADMLDYNWLHAWGSPAFVCVMKGLPAVMIIGSDIAWDDISGFTG